MRDAHVAAGQPKRGLSTDSVGSKGLRILVVDDEADVREMYVALLGLEGYQAACADTGPQGFLAIQRDSPEVALVDLDLPGFDGCELARRVRACPNGRRVLLVALTGFDHPDDRRRAAEAGFDVYLVKSADFRELLSLLERLNSAPKLGVMETSEVFISSSPSRSLPR